MMPIPKPDNFSDFPFDASVTHNLEKFLDAVSREAVGFITLTYVGTGVDNFVVKTFRPLKKVTIRKTTGVAFVLEAWRDLSLGSFVGGVWVTDGVKGFDFQGITLGLNAACNAGGTTYLLEGVY